MLLFPPRYKTQSVKEHQIRTWHIHSKQSLFPKELSELGHVLIYNGSMYVAESVLVSMRIEESYLVELTPYSFGLSLFIYFFLGFISK
jgi:hypothetical protein